MNVAFIPVRGGSKSIPLKNIKLFAGKPLVYWTIKAAVDCKEIDRIYVSTDNTQISKTVQEFRFSKVEIIGRSAESATDTASTESAMLEFAAAYDFDNIVLIQATSPLLRSEDLSKGLEALESADSVLSVVRQKRFLWKQGQNASPLNYDYMKRPRRQEFEGFLVENGAFYITSRKALLNSQCRLSGNIQTVEMLEETYFEIDERTDWIIAESMMKERLRSENRQDAIKMFLTDSDGTLTDGGMYYSENGESFKKFNTRDGMGMRLLKESGIITGIITGEDSQIVIKRGRKLGVDEIIVGAADKVKAAQDLCQKYGFTMKQIAFIGDDLNDVDLLAAVGLAICPADAMQEAKNIAAYITEASGGQGAVREAAEYVLCGEN